MRVAEFEELGELLVVLLQQFQSTECLGPCQLGP